MQCYGEVPRYDFVVSTHLMLIDTGIKLHACALLWRISSQTLCKQYRGWSSLNTNVNINILAIAKPVNAKSMRDWYELLRIDMRLAQYVFMIAFYTTVYNWSTITKYLINLGKEEVSINQSLPLSRKGWNLEADWITQRAGIDRKRKTWNQLTELR